MNSFLVSAATEGSLFLLPAHFAVELFMPVSRRQTTCLIHMYITCGGACLPAVQTVGAQSKRNPVRRYPVPVPFSGAVRTCLSDAALIMQRGKAAASWLLSKNPGKQGSHFSLVHALYYACTRAHVGIASSSTRRVLKVLLWP